MIRESSPPTQGDYDLVTFRGLDKPLEDTHKDFIKPIQQVFFRIREVILVPEPVIKLRDERSICLIVD